MTLDLLGIDASRATSARKTGTEWYSREIIRALADVRDRPRLRLYQRDAEPLVEAENVELRHIERRRLWTHLGLASELGSISIDALFVPAHVIPWRHPRTTIVTIHDLGYLYESHAHAVQRRVSLDLTTRWNAKTATRIITPSNQTRTDLADRYGVAASKVDVVPHGVDHARFRVIDRRVVDETLVSLDIQRPYLLFISTIQPRKNLARIVEAFERLDRQDLELVIAGAAGWKSESIITRIERSPRAPDIHQLGYVADDDIPALYNGAEAFVLPSLFEGFGMGILEAMACGCPVVTSNTSSLGEIAGDAAITVDPHSVEAIRSGIEQALVPRRAKELTEAGLRRAAGFTWKRTAERTLDVIVRARAQSGR